MTIQQIETRLQRAGATDNEARDLAPIMHQNGWFDIRASKPSVRVLADCATWLVDWQAERAQVAANVRRERQATRDAGYSHGQPVDAPVYLNGVTPW